LSGAAWLKAAPGSRKVGQRKRRARLFTIDSGPKECKRGLEGFFVFRRIGAGHC